MLELKLLLLLLLEICIGYTFLSSYILRHQSYQPHDFLFLLFLLFLPVHHRFDDLPFLGSQVRQVRHFGSHSQYPTPAHGTKKCHHPAQRRCNVRRPVRRHSGHGQPMDASRLVSIPRSSCRRRRRSCRDANIFVSASVGQSVSRSTLWAVVVLVPR